MEEQKFQMDFAGRPLVIEVGKLAKQASGAALVRYGDTAVFVTATGSKEAREDADFFPLTQAFRFLKNEFDFIVFLIKLDYR